MICRVACLVYLMALLQACAVSQTVDYEDVDIETAVTEIPQYELLDVGILLFDPGVPESVDKQQKEFIFPDVRRAEARYIPFHLKSTLEETGYWGSVWVIPERTEIDSVKYDSGLIDMLLNRKLADVFTKVHLDLPNILLTLLLVGTLILGVVNLGVQFYVG